MAILTFLESILAFTASFLSSIVYGGINQAGDMVYGVVPFGDSLGPGKMVKIAEGTFKSGTMVTWIQTPNGGAIKGTFAFDGDPRIADFQGFADMLSGGKPGFSVVRTPIDNYADAVRITP